MHDIGDEEERRFLVEQVMAVTKENPEQQVLRLEVNRALKAILVGCQDPQ